MLLQAFGRLPAARWFAVFALLFGILFAVITPPLSTPDEHNHFLRAYQISEGGFLSSKVQNGTGGNEPHSILTLAQHIKPFTSLDKIDTLDNIHLNTHDKIFYRFENTALYSPVAYAPQAVGILIGRIFDAPPIYLTYLARLFNVVAYVAVVYIAIRMLPFGKWAGVAVGLLPMHILLSGTTSADPFSTALAFLVVASVLRLRTYDRIMTTKEVLLLFGLTILVALAKLPYLLFLGFYLLIPARVLGGTVKRWLMLVGGLFVVAIVIAGVWLALAKGESSPYGPAFVDNAKQASFIAQHPVAFIKTLARTFLGDFGATFYKQYVASIGLLQTWPPLWATLLYTAFLTLTLYPIRAVAGTLKKYEKLLVAAIGFGCFMTTSVVLYLTWTRPGAALIDGVQMRYFTPLLFLLVPLLAVRAKSKKQATEGSLSPTWYRMVPVAFLTFVFGMTVTWYYL
jgi:uncharacterized membrane protein